MRKSIIICKYASVFISLLLFTAPESYAQTINASFAQKIAQYSKLGDFSCGFARVKKAGKWGFIDKSGNEIVECTYDYVGYYHDFMAIVRNHDGKDGYVDNMGDLVIPCKYRYAQDFSEGLAWVNDDGPWRCIDSNGKVVFTLEMMSSHRSAFKNGLSVITSPEGTCEIIDRTGKVVNWNVNITLAWEGGFEDGLLLCTSGEEDNGREVYLDNKGSIIIDCTSMQKKYSPYVDDSSVEEDSYTFHPFKNGLAPVLDMGNIKLGYIDKTGGWAIKPAIPFIMVDADVGPFYCIDGMIRTVKNFGNEDSFDFELKYGFMDSTGKLVIPYSYTDAHDFSGGLAAVRDNNGKWGFVNKKGDLVIPYKYDGVSYDGFQDGFALVVIGDKQGYVDKNGNDTFSVK